MSSIFGPYTASDAPGSKSDLKNVKPKQHQLDCYYATLAGLLRKTVPELENQTGIRAIELMILKDIKVLYKTARYNCGDSETFEKRDEIKQHILELFADGQKKLRKEEKNKLKMKLAVGFIWRKGYGHMVAAKAWCEGDKCQYRIVDYQVDAYKRLTKEKASLPQESEVLYYFSFNPIFY